MCQRELRVKYKEKQIDGYTRIGDRGHGDTYGSKMTWHGFPRAQMRLSD